MGGALDATVEDLCQQRPHAPAASSPLVAGPQFLPGICDGLLMPSASRHGGRRCYNASSPAASSPLVAGSLS